MGLFSRDTSRDTVENNQQDDFLNEPFDPVPLPNSNDLDESFFIDGNGENSRNDGFDPTSISPPTPPAPVRQAPDYGIQEVIALMRELPQEHKELVVTVVKKTLESAEIDMDEILIDAKGKEDRLRDKTQTLQTEIKQLQQEIETRNKEIAVLQKDLKETLSVKDKLELAQKLAARSAASSVDKPAENNVEKQAGTSSVKPESVAVKAAPQSSSEPQTPSHQSTRTQTTEAKPAMKKPEADGPLH